MKYMKKLLSVLVAVVMVMAMAIPAAASQTDGTGSITIKNATVGKKYSIYKLFDATADDKGNIAYTVPAGKTLGENSYFEVDAAGNVKVKQSTGIDVSTAEFKTWATGFGTQVGAETTADTTTVTFNSVPYGYYYITSELGGVITVDSVNKNIEVIDKNQGPTWDETPGEDEIGEGKVITNSDVKTSTDSKTDRTRSTANYGDTVSYRIGVNATNYVGDKQVINYFIQDKIGAGLDYDKDSIKVFIDTETALGTDEYTAEWDTDGKGFEITIPWNRQAEGNHVIKVTYDAKVTNTAAIAGEGNKNTANFTYQTKTGDNEDTKKGYEESNETTTTTYTYALGIHKIEGKTYSSLSGAKFSIKDAENHAVKAVATSTSGVYEYSTDEGAVTEFETGTDGILIIKGVKAGTYSVTETTAPKGYNKLVNPVNVTADIEETTSYTTTTTTYYNANGEKVDEQTGAAHTVTTNYSTNVVGLDVINNAGEELPSTGGMGTTIFYIVGGILVAGAAILLITRRRMSAR